MDREGRYWVVEKEEGRGVVERNRGAKGEIKGEYRGEWAAELSHTEWESFPYPLISYLTLSQSDHQIQHRRLTYGTYKTQKRKYVIKNVTFDELVKMAKESEPKYKESGLICQYMQKSS